MSWSLPITINRLEEGIKNATSFSELSITGPALINGNTTVGSNLLVSGITILNNATLNNLTSLSTLNIPRYSSGNLPDVNTLALGSMVYDTSVNKYYGVSQQPLYQPIVIGINNFCIKTAYTSRNITPGTYSSINSFVLELQNALTGIMDVQFSTTAYKFRFKSLTGSNENLFFSNVFDPAPNNGLAGILGFDENSDLNIIGSAFNNAPFVTNAYQLGNIYAEFASSNLPPSNYWQPSGSQNIINGNAGKVLVNITNVSSNASLQTDSLNVQNLSNGYVKSSSGDITSQSMVLLSDVTINSNLNMGTNNISVGGNLFLSNANGFLKVSNNFVSSSSMVLTSELSADSDFVINSPNHFRSNSIPINQYDLVNLEYVSGLSSVFSTISNYSALTNIYGTITSLNSLSSASAFKSDISALTNIYFKQTGGNINGQVTIGSTLNVNNNVLVSPGVLSISDGYGSMTFGADSTYSYIKNNVGTTVTVFNQTGNLNVGIGTTNPVSKLHVNSGDGITITNWMAGSFGGSTGNRVVLGTVMGNAVVGAHNSGLNAWANLDMNPGGLTRFTNNGESVRFVDGASFPHNYMTWYANDNTSIKGRLGFSDVSYPNNMFLQNNVVGGPITISTSGRTNLSALYINSCDANSVSMYIRNTGQSTLTLGGSGSQQTINAYNYATASAQSLNINPSGGNVMIGSGANPAYKLDVAGTVNATDLKINGVSVSTDGGLKKSVGIFKLVVSGGNIYTSSFVRGNNMSLGATLYANEIAWETKYIATPSNIYSWSISVTNTDDVSSILQAKFTGGIPSYPSNKLKVFSGSGAPLTTLNNGDYFAAVTVIHD